MTGGEVTRRELEKALRQSRRALPFNAAFALVSVVVLYLLRQHAGLPTWAACGIGVFAVFGAVSDAINIPYTKRKLRLLADDKPEVSA
jgi:hypothetical protein